MKPLLGSECGRAPNATDIHGIQPATWHQTTLAADTDILCRVYDATGMFRAGMNLSQTEAGGVFQANEQIDARVDSDGHRFAVAFNEFDPMPFDYFTWLDTIAYLPNTATLRIDEARVAAPCSDGRIAALHSGGRQASPNHAVVGWTTANNSIRGATYGAYVPGPLFSTFPRSAATCRSRPATARPSAAP